MLNYFVGIKFLPAHILDSQQIKTKASILNDMYL